MRTEKAIKNVLSSMASYFILTILGFIVQSVLKHSLGAEYLAGLYTKFFDSVESIEKLHEIDKVFMPIMNQKKRQYLVDGWKCAVNATRMFKR